MGLLDRLRRLVGTGLAFASLGLGGMVLAATVFPVIALISGNTGDRIRRTQHVVHWSFRLYILLLRHSRIIDLDVSAIGGIPACRGSIIVANHPTLLDVVLLMSLNPHLRCIVKHQLWENPFLSGVVKSAGYIRNDLPSDAMARACSEALASGSNLLVFPEGTRSHQGEIGRFHRGFANLAMLTGTEIRMVLITCNPVTLVKGEPWWRIPDRRPTFRVADMGALEASDYLSYPYRSIGARRLVACIEERYSDRLAKNNG